MSAQTVAPRPMIQRREYWSAMRPKGRECQALQQADLGVGDAEVAVHRL
jgi:hypothetical protein